MFTIRNYETPNQIKFVTLKSRKAKRSERVATLKRRIAGTIAVIILILAIGYVGEQDRQYELISNGIYTEKENK